MPLHDDPIYALAQLATASGLCIQPVQPNVDNNPVSLAVAKHDPHKYFVADPDRSNGTMLKEIRNACLRVLPGAVVVEAQVKKIQAMINAFQQDVNIKQDPPITFCDARDELFYGFFKVQSVYEKANISNGHANYEYNDVFAILSVFRKESVGIRSRRQEKQFEYYDANGDVNRKPISQMSRFDTCKDFVLNANKRLYNSFVNNAMTGLCLNDHCELVDKDERNLDTFNLGKYWDALIVTAIDETLNYDLTTFTEDLAPERASTFSDPATPAQPSHHSDKTKASYITYEEGKERYLGLKHKYVMMQAYAKLYGSNKTLIESDRNAINSIHTTNTAEWEAFCKLLKEYKFDLNIPNKNPQDSVPLGLFTNFKFTYTDTMETSARWLQLVTRLANALAFVGSAHYTSCDGLNKYSLLQHLTGLQDNPHETETNRQFLKGYMLNYITLIHSRVMDLVLDFNTPPAQTEYWRMHTKLLTKFKSSNLTFDSFSTCFDEVEEWLRVSVNPLTVNRYSKTDTWTMLFKPSWKFTFIDKGKRLLNKLPPKHSMVQVDDQNEDEDVHKFLQQVRGQVGMFRYTKDAEFSNQVACTPKGIVQSIVSLVGGDTKHLELLIENTVDLESSFQTDVYCLCEAVCALAQTDTVRYQNIFVRFKGDIWVAPPKLQTKNGFLEVSVVGSRKDCSIVSISKSKTINASSVSPATPTQTSRVAPTLTTHSTTPLAAVPPSRVAQPQSASTQPAAQPQSASTQPAAQTDERRSWLSRPAFWIPHKALWICRALVIIATIVLVYMGYDKVYKDPIVRAHLKSIAANVTTEVIERSNPTQLYVLEQGLAGNVSYLLEGRWDTASDVEFGTASRLFAAANDYGTSIVKDISLYNAGAGLVELGTKQLELVIIAVLVSLALGAFVSTTYMHKSSMYMLSSTLVTLFQLNSDTTLVQSAGLSLMLGLSCEGGERLWNAFRRKRYKANRKTCLEAWNVSCVSNISEQVAGIDGITFGCSFNPSNLFNSS